MKKLLLGAVGALLLAGGPAWALPSFCTGTTVTVASGTFEPGSFLVGTGNCVLASDKYFGGFTVGGVITAGGSAGWLFTLGSGPADVTIGFQGLVGPSATGSVGYKVEVNPANSNGALISALEKDFTFNSTGTGSTATLTGNVVPAANISFSCTRTVSTTTCPQTGSFNPLTADLAVGQTITTGPNTNVTAITDTLFQVVPSIPEPSSLGILGTALLLTGWVYRRKYGGKR